MIRLERKWREWIFNPHDENFQKEFHKFGQLFGWFIYYTFFTPSKAMMPSWWMSRSTLYDIGLPSWQMSHVKMSFVSSCWGGNSQSLRKKPLEVSMELRSMFILFHFPFHPIMCMPKSITWVSDCWDPNEGNWKHNGFAADFWPNIQCCCNPFGADAREASGTIQWPPRGCWVLMYGIPCFRFERIMVQKRCVGQQALLGKKQNSIF